MIMTKRAFFSVLCMTGLFSLFMFLFPQIDLSISGFFYQPGEGFLLERFYNQWHLEIFRNALVYTTYALLTVLILSLIGGILFKNFIMPISPKVCLFLLFCFASAPALLVNDVLKNHWGRARPFQIQQFDGPKIFTPAWVISSQCDKNCSFTSGETANVFCYLAFLFITRRKKLVAGVVFFFGGLTAFERVAQGYHFFSDALLSGFLDYLLIWIIYQIMERKLFFLPDRFPGFYSLTKIATKNWEK